MSEKVEPEEVLAEHETDHGGPEDTLADALRTALKERDEARAVLTKWVEYYDAIESGEYPSARPEIRAFEKVLLERSREVIKND